jgi:hypothetical protein
MPSGTDFAAKSEDGFAFFRHGVHDFLFQSARPVDLRHRVSGESFPAEFGNEHVRSEERKKRMPV